MSSDPSQTLQAARLLDQAGKHEEALLAFQNHLDAHPESVEGWVDYGGLLMIRRRIEDAQTACERALALSPHHYGAQVHAACVLMHKGLFAAAIARFQDAIAQEPQRIAGRLMLADCLTNQGNLTQARNLLEAILTQDPHHAVALDRRNTLLVLQEDWPNLRRDLERQVNRYAGAEGDYAASHLDLMFGDMPRGWERFERRLELPGRALRAGPASPPRWDGQPFPGQTLLVTWEQGFGDTLMFLRFLPLAKALGGRILLDVQPPLLELAATCPGADELLLPGEPTPPVDWQVSMLSLPWLFKTSLETIPAEIPYLRVPVDVPDRAGIDQALSAAQGSVRVGVCWAGNASHPKDALRSMPPATLALLADLPDVAWCNFQFDAKQAPPLPGLIPLGPLLKGFPNTAYALSQMDLIITVDTVLAHLAGALGVPAFLMLSFLPDWRWMLGRNDSPWYPTLRLYRQHAPGDWASALRAAVADLTVSS